MTDEALRAVLALDPSAIDGGAVIDHASSAVATRRGTVVRAGLHLLRLAEEADDVADAAVRDRVVRELERAGF